MLSSVLNRTVLEVMWKGAVRDELKNSLGKKFMKQQDSVRVLEQGILRKFSAKIKSLR